MDCSLAKYTRHDGVLFGGSETAPTLGFASAYGESTAKAMMRSAWCIRRLTFELSRPRRCGAWPARRMMTARAWRAKCHAGAGRLERRVRQHCLGRTELTRECAAHRPCLALSLADAPAWRISATATQPAAIASGERRQSLPSGGGTTD